MRYIEKKQMKKYNEMLKYFSQFYSEEKKVKKEKAYKEKARIRKIAERYEEMKVREEVNKVRKNGVNKKEEYAGIIMV